MPDYIYSISPIYPLIESVIFSTTVLYYDSLFSSIAGSPTEINLVTNIPPVCLDVMDNLTRKTIVSDSTINRREQRSLPYEREVRAYTLLFKGMTPAEKLALETYFIARKGRKESFYITHSELFGGIKTLVRCVDDRLNFELTDWQQWQTSLGIQEALNGVYRNNQYTTKRNFTLFYGKEDLSTLETFFKTTVSGRYGTFSFNPYNIADFLSNTTYTVRFDMDSFITAIKDDTWKQVMIDLKEVIT